MSLNEFNPICPGDACMPHICIYLCKYMYECIEKTWLFPIIGLEKGNMLFTRQSYLVSASKKKVRQK